MSHVQFLSKAVSVIFLTTFLEWTNALLFNNIFPNQLSPSRENFRIYWNVPTFQCHKYGMNFQEVSRDYGIIQNDDDEFRGNKIAILYDPGNFPALLKDKNSFGLVRRRNGGVPQEGNLTLHLEIFRDHVLEQIKNETFDGVAVIDFESWRPIFRQNWASLAPYRELSLQIEGWRHPLWPQTWLKTEAEKRFNDYARMFMEETLKYAKKIRPRASWGYYAFPYCFNWRPNQQSDSCMSQVVSENNRMSWLFGNEQIIMPSIYMQQKLSSSQRSGLVRGRVHEASRLRNNLPNKSTAKILPYFWYKYQDYRDTFLNLADIDNALREILRQGGDGMIIWGSSKDVDSEAKCQLMRNYLRKTLGPSIKRFMTEGFYNYNV